MTGHRFVVDRKDDIPLNNVEVIAIAMKEPLAEATLDVRSLQLTTEFPGNAVLEAEPLVDEFGQWIRDDWPRKVRTLNELQETWRREEKELKPGDFDYCRYGVLS